MQSVRTDDWSFCHLCVSFYVRVGCDSVPMHTTRPITPGDLIRICRADRRWSQEALAKRVGCARNTIARIENGSQPSPKTVRRLAEVLNLDVELLLPQTETGPSEDEPADTHTTNDLEVESEH